MEGRAGPVAETAGTDQCSVEADRLGVLPAVANNLHRESPRWREITARNLWLKQEQERSLAVLRDAGIRAHAVKGVGLAERLYPDLTWREVTDIDLLVDGADAGAAFERLRSAGLEPNHPWNAAALARQLLRPLSLAPELVFTAPSGLLVELHWDWPGRPLPPTDLWEQPEHYLVYLCRHAGNHFWSRLKWSCDIELLLRRYGDQLDWRLFWRVADESGAVRSCAVSLELGRRWFGRGGLPGLDERLSRPVRRLADRAAGELLNPAASPSHPVWSKLRLAPWRERPGMLRSWLEPQPQEWTRAGSSSAAQVWFERLRHLWSRWAPHRVRRLTAAEWVLLAEAWATVALVEAARRTVSFQRLTRFADSRRRPGRAEGWTLERLRRVAWLVDVAANRQPVTIQCLTRSLALAWMLYRRGVDVELRLGVRRPGDQLEAHCWLEWRGQVLHDPQGQAEQYLELPEALAAR